MAVSFTRFARRAFLLIHIVAAVLFLLACFGPYLSSHTWWPISFLGLVFGGLLLVQVFFILFWIIFYPRYALISIAVLLIGYKAVSVFIAVRPLPDFVAQKKPGHLRVMHWNVARFIELHRNDNRGSRTRAKMMDLIKRQNADVLCMQEFYYSTDSNNYNNLTYIQKELGYPYAYLGGKDDGDKQWYGQAIFSRYPIVDSATLFFPKPTITEALIHADVVFGGDTVRFLTTHLQSVQFKKEDYQNIEEIKHQEDSILQNSRNIFSKLKRGYQARAIQTGIVRREIEKSPHPVIITGDFNDVPNSYTYYTIGKGLQDAFLQKGAGVGRTYSGISPTLRIDYILAGKAFEVQQFQRIVRSLSDHYPLVADFALKKK